MSGNYDDAGCKLLFLIFIKRLLDRNNPSDLIKDYRKEKLKAGPSDIKKDRMDDEWIDRTQLAEEMKEEHGFTLKGHVLSGMFLNVTYSKRII